MNEIKIHFMYTYNAELAMIKLWDNPNILSVNICKNYKTLYFPYYKTIE